MLLTMKRIRRSEREIQLNEVFRKVLGEIAPPVTQATIARILGITRTGVGKKLQGTETLFSEEEIRKVARDLSLHVPGLESQRELIEVLPTLWKQREPALSIIDEALRTMMSDERRETLLVFAVALEGKEKWELAQRLRALMDRD